MQKNSITNKITPCCGLPFSVIYWWVSNLTLNSESDRQYLLTQISQSGVLSIDGWKVLINSGTLEADASLTKADFLAWFDCGKQPNCEQLKLIIEGYKLGVWVGDLNEIRFENVLGVLEISDPAPTTIGLYRLSEVGTYVNLGGLVTTAGKINDAYFDGTTWSKVEVETNVPNGNVEEGNTQAVSGGEVFNKRGYAYVGEKANLNEAIVSVIPAQRKLGFELSFYNTTLSMLQTYKYVASYIGAWETLGQWKEVSRAGQIYNLQGSYTLTTAINAIPNTQRKSGLIITFQDSNSGNRVRSYIFTAQSINSWALEANWREIIVNSDLMLKLESTIKNSLYASFENNTVFFRTEYKSADVANIDGDFSIIIDLGINKIPSSKEYIVGKGATAYTHNGWGVYVENDRIYFSIKEQKVSVKYELNSINRYVFRKVGRVMSIYKNGVLITSVEQDRDLNTSNTDKIFIGAYSYNNTGAPLTVSLGNIAITEDVSFLTSTFGNIDYYINESSLNFATFLKQSELTSTALTTDSKGNQVQLVGGVPNFIFKKNAVKQSDYESIYPSFIEMYKEFPETAKIGKYIAYRNTDVKSGVITNDYDVNYGNELKTLQILEKRTLSNLIYAVDKYGVCYGVRNNNIIVKSEDAGVTWTDLLTISTLNKISFIYCTNDNELLLLEDTYRDDANLSNDRLGGIWKINNNKTNATKVHTLLNRYQSFQPSWCIEIVDSTIYYSEYGNSYYTQSYDPSWNKGTKGDAVRVWKSNNNGDTWNLLVNLNDLTGLYPNDGNLHIHSIHWDSYWNRLWLTSGDWGASAKSNKKLIWTDDQVSWKGIELSNYFNGGFQGSVMTPYENLQGLSMFSTNDFLLIGSDNWHNAIFRVNKRKKDDISLDIAFETSPIVDDVVYFTGRMKKIDSLPILIQLGRGDATTDVGIQNQKPKIIATYNGFNFKDVWNDTSVLSASDFTFQFFKIKGSYYFTYKDFIVRFEY